MNWLMIRQPLSTGVKHQAITWESQKVRLCADATLTLSLLFRLHLYFLLRRHQKWHRHAERPESNTKMSCVRTEGADTHTHTYTTSEWVIGVSVCHCVKQIHAEIASKWHRTLQLCSLYVYLLLRHVACVWMCVSVCVPACVFPLPFARCVTVWVRSHERSSAAVMRITASEYKKKKKICLVVGSMSIR